MAKCGKYDGEKLWKPAGKAMKRVENGHILLYGRLQKEQQNFCNGNLFCKETGKRKS